MARITIIAGQAHSLVNFRGPLIEMLLAMGHDVSAIGPPAAPATLAWLSARRVDYRSVPLLRASLDPFQDVKAFLAIRSALVAARADAVLAFTIKAVIYGLLAAKSVGVPRRYALISGLGYAFTEGASSSLKRRLVGTIARQLYRLSLAQAEAVIFQNRDDLELFEKLRLVTARNRTGVVNGSGVDLAHFGVAPLPAEPICLMIARLVADKGINEYLAAARAVKTSRPDVKFLLVGATDPNPSAVSQDVLDQAIADGIIDYLGELADVRPAIAQASIYVLPSYREGTPRSVLEAMAMGRPVVTTDAPGCRDTVEAGINGLLVPVKTIPELAGAIQTLVDDPALRQQMGEAGRARAVARYASDRVARSVIDLLALPESNTPKQTSAARSRI